MFIIGYMRSQDGKEAGMFNAAKFIHPVMPAYMQLLWRMLNTTRNHSLSHCA